MKVLEFAKLAVKANDLFFQWLIFLPHWWNNEHFWTNFGSPYQQLCTVGIGRHQGTAWDWNCIIQNIWLLWSRITNQLCSLAQWFCRINCYFQKHVPTHCFQNEGLVLWHVPGYQPHIERLISADVRQVGFCLVAICWVSPCDMRMEIVIHSNSSRLIHFAWSFKYDRLVTGAIPWIVVAITIAYHRLLSTGQLWKLPACTEISKKTYDIFNGSPTLEHIIWHDHCFNYICNFCLNMHVGDLNTRMIESFTYYPSSP